VNENKDSSLPTRLTWLLIYQWILVLVSLYFVVTSWRLFLTYPEYGFVLQILVLACWATAISYASVGMARRSPRGLLVGMICHLLLEIPALPIMLYYGFISFQPSIWSDSGSRGWNPLFLLFALMWLPFVVLSAWAFFYLRKLRRRLFYGFSGP
jgi:hypothetical protein